MAVPSPVDAVAAFASFVRGRLSDVSETLGWPRRGDGEVTRADGGQDAVGTARQLAMVIIGAAAPFAPTAQARARLLRQAHASGLLSDREAAQFRRAEQLALGGHVEPTGASHR